MKEFLILFSLLCFFSSKSKASIYGQQSKVKVDTLPTDQLVQTLQQMKIASYYGKPVDSFLLALPTNLYNLKIYGGSNSQGAHFRASYLTVDFTISLYGPGVKIYVREFTHMNRYSPTATWDVSLFRKEKIYKIDVYKDQNTCINGDCMN